MNEGPQTVRLSILVFDDQRTLWRAIGELLHRGLDGDQICLVGFQDSLAGLALPDEAEASDNTDLSGFLRPNQVPIKTDGRANLVGRCGPPPPGSRAPCAIETDFSWMDHQLSAKLITHARLGAVLLFVRAKNSEQHAVVGRILLRHGRHNLQTHEYTARSDISNGRSPPVLKPGNSEQS